MNSEISTVYSVRYGGNTKTLFDYLKRKDVRNRESYTQSHAVAINMSAEELTASFNLNLDFRQDVSESGGDILSVQTMTNGPLVVIVKQPSESKALTWKNKRVMQKIKDELSDCMRFFVRCF